MSAVNVLLGILIGLTIGGTMGIIIAPNKGVNSRNKLSIDGNGQVDGNKNKVENPLVTTKSDLE